MAKDCLFRMCTDVGRYKISTIGALYQNSKMETIGCDRHYATFVFRIDRDGVILDHFELDSDGVYLEKKMSPYDADDAAERMHIKMCAKYAELQ